jgi:regulator of protease activity HflC (stomatin/prohibitin superfamily)
VNEKHIQQVIEIEKRAQEIHEAAMKEAQQLPVIAEQEAQAEAEQEAREMVSKVQADEEGARILSEVEEKNRQFETVAMSNLDRAVEYVLERVIGRA